MTLGRGLVYYLKQYIDFLGDGVVRGVVTLGRGLIIFHMFNIHVSQKEILTSWGCGDTWSGADYWWD